MALISGGLLLLKLRSFGGFAARNWKLVIIVLLVGGIAYYHWDRTRTIEKLREEVQTLEQNIANCKGALQRQNSIIDQSSTRSKELLEQERQKTAAAIAAEREKAQRAIEALRGKELAQTCDEAVDELIDSAQEDLRW